MINGMLHPEHLINLLPHFTLPPREMTLPMREYRIDNRYTKS